jgi:hypothetical protein
MCWQAGVTHWFEPPSHIGLRMRHEPRVRVLRERWGRPTLTKPVVSKEIQGKNGIATKEIECFILWERLWTSYPFLCRALASLPPTRMGELENYVFLFFGVQTDYPRSSTFTVPEGNPSRILRFYLINLNHRGLW